VAAAEPLIGVLDQHLARHAFVAGDRLTMADLPLACEVHRWIGLPRPRTERAHLDRWYDKMRARPSARGVLDQPLV
jgi:glutathione S-transferase